MSSGSETGTLQFTLSASDGREFLLELRQGQVILAGRDLGAEVVIPDGRVSRHHSGFSLESSGLWIEDLHSQNGTHVNSERIQRARLEHGDSISLGGYEFIMKVAGEAETRAAAPGELSPAAAEALASISTELPADSPGKDIDLFLEALAGRLEAVFIAAFRVDYETRAVRCLARLDFAGSREGEPRIEQRTLPSDFLDRVIETGEADWLRLKEESGGAAGGGRTDAVAAAPSIIETVISGLVYLEREAAFKPLDLEILSGFTASLSGFFTAGKTEAAGKPARGFYKRLEGNETPLRRSGSIRPEGGVAEIAEDLVDTIGDQPDL